MNYEVFEDLCNKNAVKPAQVSRATGISTATLSSWKKGTYAPKIEKLQKIADFFHVSVDYLVGTVSLPDDASPYYQNPETMESARFLYENPEYKMLFNVMIKVKKEDIEFTAKLIEKIVGTK